MKRSKKWNKRRKEWRTLKVSKSEIEGREKLDKVGRVKVR